MENRSLTFAKIGATPTPTSWSQAYNAGSLFAVLSLSIPPDADSEELSLNSLGKELLSTLEEEYFTLETKNLEAIKKAVQTTIQKIPDTIESSLVIVSVINDVLYGYVYGTAEVSIKRGSKVATILKATDSSTLKTGSGNVLDNDIIILGTKTFYALAPHSEFTTTFENNTPADIAEILLPKVHEKEDGGICAIIIRYSRPIQTPIIEEENTPLTAVPNDEEKPTETEDIAPHSAQKPFSLMPMVSSYFNSIKNFIPPLPLTRLSHTNRLFLTIALVLGVVLIGSILFAISKDENTKSKKAFDRVYQEAKTKYDEGQSLANLNRNLSQEDLKKAKEIITKGKSDIKAGSVEDKKLDELLSQIEASLDPETPNKSASAKQVEASESPLLDSLIKNRNVLFATQKDSTIYLLSQEDISTQISDKKEKIITNNDDWQKASGIGEYNGNLYVLDKDANTILKYVPTEEEFGKREYLAGTPSKEFSTAAAMTIDTAVYVLHNDGTIKKFLRGKEEKFEISGLTPALSNPTRVYTNDDNDYLYVLDNGNSRIVVLRKDGSVNTQYQADVIKNAKDFDVKESSKKIFVLSNGKVYQIDLK